MCDLTRGSNEKKVAAIILKDQLSCICSLADSNGGMRHTRLHKQTTAFSFPWPFCLWEKINILITERALLLMHFQQSTASITCIYLQVRIYFLLCAVRFVFMRKWKGLRHYCAGRILMRCRQCQLPQLFTCKCLNKSGSCMDAFTPCNRNLYTCVGLYEKRLLGCCHGDALTIILSQGNLKGFL